MPSVNNILNGLHSLNLLEPMGDKEIISVLYREMYQAMVEKDVMTLEQIHVDDFVLTHMTGMRQSKQDYIQSIAN